jgi:hypothetical protein
VKLLAALGLVILSAFAAQPPINGKLVAVGQDSISVEVNQQITTVHIAPDTEIWRRGIDLTDLHELVLGDEIGVTYRRAAADGSPIPTLIVAFEEGDIVDPVPHHVGEYRVCAGLLSKVAGDRIWVKNILPRPREEEEKGICVMRVPASASIWRGETVHDLSVLKIGDVIGASTTVTFPSGELIATEISANKIITEGVIVSVRPGRVVIRQVPGTGEYSAIPRTRIAALIDSRTTFEGGVEQDLRMGTAVQAEGLGLGFHWRTFGPNEFRASVIKIHK